MGCHRGGPYPHPGGRRRRTGTASIVAYPSKVVARCIGEQDPRGGIDIEYLGRRHPDVQQYFANRSETRGPSRWYGDQRPPLTHITTVHNARSIEV